jgi:hypothetical protein
MSTKTARLNGDPATFRNEVRMYWLVDGREYNGKLKKEDDTVTQEQFNEMMDVYLTQLAAKDVPEWAKTELQEAIDLGITDGTRPMQLIPRYQAAIMAKRAAGK